jgi:hypothetical protein
MMGCELAAGPEEAAKVADQLFPDPVLTASLYCVGRLDQAIFHAVALFWRELRRHDPERLCYLWLMRYGKGGEHLKVRIHGPESLRPLIRGLLEEKAARFLDSLPEAEAPPSRTRQRVPAIDAEEDEVDGGRPDRTLLWTTYRRSPVSLGGKPFLLDDRYAALLTRCLASACERVLALQPYADGSLPHRVRQGALLKALIRGLAALGFPAGKRVEYLAYHRDWLLRYVLPQIWRSEAEAVEHLQRRLDEQMAGMAGSRLPLRRALDEDSTESGPDMDWERSLSGLLAYVSPLCRDPDYRLDPFASDPVFAPVFKVFHGLANQLGLRQRDEAFAHHLLLRMAAS